METSHRQMSCTMRNPTICKCENKDADQLCGNLCFRYTDSPIPQLSKFLACFCDCTCQFVSGLPGNHNVGFLTLGSNIGEAWAQNQEPRFTRQMAKPLSHGSFYCNFNAHIHQHSKFPFLCANLHC